MLSASGGDDAIRWYEQASICEKFSVAPGWNLLSVPVVLGDMSPAALFPEATSAAFAYAPGTGYTAADPLEPARGYWVKFASRPVYEICGRPVAPQEIPVASGWNMIGAFEATWAVAGLESAPAGIITSSYFAYASGTGYSAATHLKPGQGYWVKANESGVIRPAASKQGAPEPALVAAAGEADPAWVRLVVEDGLGRRRTLYLSAGEAAERFELPPLPPGGGFDVRFEGGRSALSEASGTLQLQGLTSPVRLEAVYLAGGVLRVGDGLGGTLLAATLKEGETLTLPSGLSAVEVAVEGGAVGLPSVYSLGQNYPNPFNPTTEIRFTLPQTSAVKIEVYDLLGRRVAVLVEGELAAGRHRVRFDAAGLASGVYVYRMEAGAYVETRRLTLLR